MNKRGLAISQIFILVVGIVAVAYAIGSEVRVVGATIPKGSELPGRYSWKLHPEEGELFIYNEESGGYYNPDYYHFDKNGNLIPDEQQNAQTSQGGTTSLPNIVSVINLGKELKRGYDWVNGKWVVKGTTAATSGTGAKVGEEVAKQKVPFYISWWKKIPAPIQNAGKAATIYFTIKLGLNILGADKELSEAASRSAAIGYYAATTIKWASEKAAEGGGLMGSIFSKIPYLAKLGQYSSLIGWGFAIGYFLATFKNTKTEKIIFECKPWQAPTGGSKCDECNKQGILECNKYQCKSLGQSCDLVNEGTTEEKCAWVNQKDVTPPEIKIDENTLLNDYKYSSKTATGVKIEYTKSDDKCIPAFTPFTFGFNTNELSRCRADFQRKEKFDEMTSEFGGNNYLLSNHIDVVTLPGPSAREEGNITIPGGGNYELFVRCQDANGNTKTADFVFKFCIDKGPDSTAPVIEGTSPLLNGMPVSFGTQKMNLDVYTNKPADCKWSTKNQDYDRMEHDMSCAQDVGDINAQMLYTCTAKLEDLKGRQDNIFYFRCKSYPLKEEGERHAMGESYKFILKGSQPLVIDSVGPNGTIKDSTAFVKVTLEAKTSAGYNEGEATCEYSEDGEKYIKFFNTHSYKHSQDLALSKGSYTFYIKCFDLAGNSETKTVSFNVESDPYAPTVVRVYYEDNNLKLITNEKAECVYYTKSCNYLFKDGTQMTTSDGKIHLTYWNPKTNFYVKCKDEYGNQPNPNECSIAIKPLKI